jgi:hypothetical protein
LSRWKKKSFKKQYLGDVTEFKEGRREADDEVSWPAKRVTLAQKRRSRGAISSSLHYRWGENKVSFFE